MEARNLRMLLIDDQPKNLVQSLSGFDSVEVPVYGTNGTCTSSCIALFVQLLEILANPTCIEADLLCIDIKFHMDTTDLPFYNETLVDAPDESRPNPMGLLHGAVIAALFKYRRRPFAFTIFSGGARELNRDPIANYGFGVLTALQGFKFSQHYNAGEVRDAISRMIGEFGQSDLVGVKGRVLASYRAQLRDFVAVTGGIDCETNVQALIDACERAQSDSDCFAIADLGLVLRIGEEIDLIRVGSLFADCSTFGIEHVQNIVLPQLRELKDVYHAHHNALYDLTVSCLEVIEEAQDAETYDETIAKRNRSVLLETLRSTWNAENSQRRPEFEDLALAVLLCTLVELWQQGSYCRDGLRDTTLAKLGNPDQKTVDRLLEAIRRRHEECRFEKSIGSFIEASRAPMALPANVRRCVAKYAFAMCQLEGSQLPPFLRDISV